MASRRRSKSASRLNYMSHDWPDHMHMTEEAFAEYASAQERDDFEGDIRNLGCTLHQLVLAREDSITKLRRSADYLDSVWFGCKVSKGVGTSASVVGGGLTIAGGILTMATAGAAAPLLIAGLATSSVGAATNIGTSVVEKAVSSKEVRGMSNALNLDHDLALKMESQIDAVCRFKDSLHLGALLAMAETICGRTHLVVAILNGVFSFDTSGLLSLSGRFFTDGIRLSVEAMSRRDGGEAKLKASGSLGSAAFRGVSLAEASKEAIAANPVAVGTAAAAGIAVAGAAIAAVSTSTSSTSTTVTKATRLRYNPVGPEIFLETGKVVGQNSTRLAGKVIVGLSAAFLVWDAIDLGLTVNDLVRKKGSQAGRILRVKADELEEALEETRSRFSLDMAEDSE